MTGSSCLAVISQVAPVVSYVLLGIHPEKLHRCPAKYVQQERSVKEGHVGVLNVSQVHSVKVRGQVSR